MRIRDVAIAASTVLALYAVSPASVLAQSPPGGFPSVVKELRTAPGCLGVETGQTAGGPYHAALCAPTPRHAKFHH